MALFNPEIDNALLITGIHDENGEIQQQDTAVMLIRNAVFSLVNPCFVQTAVRMDPIAIHDK